MAESMVFDISARDNASGKLAEIGRNVDKLADKLDALGRREIKPKITLDSDRAKTRLDEFNRALRDISNKRVRVDVDVNGRTEVGDLRRELAYMVDKRIKIRVDTADSNQKLKTITDRLDKIKDTRAKVDITVTGEAKLDQVLAKLTAIRDMSPVRVVVDVVTGSAVADLREIERLLGRINGRNASATVSIREQWDRSIEGRISGLGAKLMLLPAAASAASAGLGVAGGAVASLATALAQAAGAAGIVPGALAAIGAVAATVTVGVQGMGDAFKAVAEGDPQKLAEATQGLAGSARELVGEVGKLKPAWDSLQLDVQERLFYQTGQAVQRLGATYLPVLRVGLTGIANELNQAGQNLVNFATSGQAVERVEAIFSATRTTVSNLAPAVDDVAAGLLDIGEVGATMLPGLTSGIEGAAVRFREFIAAARESGQLEQWIQGGIDRLAQLGNIAGNVGGVLAGVWQASTAAGGDFVTLLQRATQGLEDFVRSSAGQQTLTAFFTEARQTVDALVPGLQAAAQAVQGFMTSFDASDGMVRFGQATSDVLVTLEPLIAALGRLAGDTLAGLSSSLSNVAGLLSPLASGFSGFLGVLGPIPGIVTAMVLAFAGMRLVSTYLTAAQVSLNAFAAAQFTAAAASTSAAAAYARTGAALGAAGLAGAVGAAARALPLLAVGFVAVSAAYDAFATHSDEAVQQVIQGHMSMRDAIQQAADAIDANGIDWLGGADAQQALAMATAEVNAEFQAQYDALSPMEKLQADVAMARKELNDALASGDVDGAAAASGRLRDAEQRLAGVEKEAADATRDHTEAIKAQADEISGQANAHIAYEQSVRRTADAHRAAADALRESGANSDQYQGAVLDLTSNMLSQAEAARRQAEELGGAEAGARAYNLELLKLNDGTQQGRDAFMKFASGLSQSSLDAISATSAMSGLGTEIVNLPNGKTVTVIAATDTSQIPVLQAQLDAVAATEYVGTVRITADPTVFQDTIRQSVELANGTTATMTLAGNGEPLSIEVEGQKYKIDQTTGTMTIDGDPAPGKANLSGLKVEIDSTTGVLKISGDPTQANSALAQALDAVRRSVGTFTIDGDPTMANGKVTQAVRFADGSRGTITVDGNPDPATGKVNATVQYADGRTARITVDANTGPATAAMNGWIAAWGNRKINVTVGANVVTTGTARVNYHGAIRNPDGVALFAPGGVARGLTPMAVGQPAAVPPNTWRVVGDRSDVNESYIPWKPQDARAQSLLEITARALGRTVLPMALGGILAFAPGGVAPASAPRPAPPAAAPASPTLDPAYADALKAAADAGAELNEVQQLVADTATALGEQTALTTEQVAALTTAAQEATTADQAYQVGLTALQLANDTVTLAAQTRTAAEQVATEATNVALGQTNAYTGGLTALGSQAAGGTTAGINTLTGAVQAETSTEATAQGQAQAYTGGLAALGGQAGGATTGGMNTLTGAVNAAGGASVTATGQAQGHTTALGALGAQGGTTAGGLGQTTAAAQTLGGAHAAAGAQAQGQSGDLQALAGSAGQAAGELRGVADAVSSLPDGQFTVTANGRLGEVAQAATGGILSAPQRYATGGVTPGFTPGRDVHMFISPTGGRLELSGGEAVMRPEWTRAVGAEYVHAANAAARAGTLPAFLARTAAGSVGSATGDGEYYAAGGIRPSRLPMQRFALGGQVARMDSPRFPDMPQTLWDQLSEQMADRLTPMMQQRIAEEQAKLLGSGSGQGWEWQMSVLRAAFPGLAMNSGYRPGAITATGNRSYHSMGRAVDVPPRMDVFNWIRANYGANTKELIYTPAGGAQIHNGSPHVYTGVTAANHYDHVHWAMRNGGVVPSFDRGGLASGRGLMLKDIIKPERILDANTTKAFDRLASVLPQAMAAQPGRVQLGRPGPVVSAGGGAGQWVSAVQAEVSRQISAIQAVAADLAQRPAVTVNDTSGNPVEAGRAAALAYRMAR